MAAKASSARPVWTGSISFGLVTIPIKLFTAVREQRISFRSLHDQDQVPLKQKMVCPADGKEVHSEHIVKGYEIEKDRFVVIQQGDLEAVMPKASKAIEIQDFVELDDIDPLYFDRPYYVAPKPEGAKPYRLLLEAMQKSGKVGIATIVMHNKQYLAALRPLGDALCLETMHFDDEVVPESTVPDLHHKAKVDDRELKIAQQLIDSLTTEFKPDKYKDEYRQRVLELIEKKAKGQKVVNRPESTASPRKANDLIAALEASLAKTKSEVVSSARTPRRRKSA
ncbi:MAG TPA: Ku protein [Tepidisphaeraceae bacterium]|jgi:DNA end-binding protein Ku|nr:Ku protein [Tepidisphaeraceae bacterium]